MIQIEINILSVLGEAKPEDDKPAASATANEQCR
jgi:hypothetical protein